jgi:hypothetical protein
MLKIKCESEEAKERAKQLMRKIENLRSSRLFCLYHEQSDDIIEILDHDALETCGSALTELGHLKKLSVLVDSPGGDAEATFRLIKKFRRVADEVEAIVVNWSKSAATIFCLGADKIFMGEDAELGPLDAQLRNPKTGKRFSALNSFKSLEFLRQYSIEVLDIISILIRDRVKMDYIYAVEVARPVVSDIVTSLYEQVNPSELGESRRHLAVGEQYSKMIMERYSYKDYSQQKIEEIVRTLVWNYPSHGFVIDFEEATRIGLKVERLDAECNSLCLELLSSAKGCIGFVENAEAATVPANPQVISMPTPELGVTNEMPDAANGSKNAAQAG